MEVGSTWSLVGAFIRFAALFEAPPWLRLSLEALQTFNLIHLKGTGNNHKDTSLQHI